MHAMIVGASDKRAWELVTNVPKMKTLPGYGCGIANLVVPGLGTFICAYLSDKNLNKTQFLMGITQFLAAPYIIGYLLSIYWAWLMVMKAGKKDEPLMPSGQTRSDAPAASMGSN